MKKRPYRAVRVNKINVEELSRQVAGGDVVLGVDVAKEDFVAALRVDGEVVRTLKWKHPAETAELVELVRQVAARASRFAAAMEPSGSYGAILHAMLWEAGVEVYKVSPKRVHDAMEVYDGVPSSHDGKCAAIIAKLHADGASRLWERPDEQHRELSVRVKAMNRHDEWFRRLSNHLEAVLAVHWPELPQLLSLDSATLLALVREFGSAQQVARVPSKAKKLMAEVSRGKLSADKIAAVVQAAEQTSGLEPIAAERQMLQELAGEIQKAKARRQHAHAQVEALIDRGTHASATSMSDLIGLVTAAVVVSQVGDPRLFESAGAWLKAMGLNLKIHSSGKKKGKLALSKRGSGMARKYLYLAALRLVQHDAVVRAWYERKVQRDGQRDDKEIKLKAVVAVMRKLAKALWYVAGGETFDATKLFDVRRLHLQDARRAAA